jgi:hypothetical protein
VGKEQEHVSRGGPSVPSTPGSTRSPQPADSDAAPTGLALLREPFPPHQISKKPKPLKKDSQRGNCRECGGYHGLPAIHLDYVGHAALTDRLLDADPTWTWEPVADPKGLGLPTSNDGMWIRLTVCGVTRLGFGSSDGKQGGDGVKEVIGDALRNAAMRFGAALDLWHKGQLHEDEEPATAPTAAKPEPVKAEAPEGFDNWMADMQAVADNGLDALRDAWKKSQPYMRKYCTDNALWEGLKERAEKAGVAA